MLVWRDKVNQGLYDDTDTACVSSEIFTNGADDTNVTQRIEELETKLENIQQSLQKITKTNENTKQDMKFFETMLLEEYHLLLQLLGKDQNLRIHQVSSDTLS